VAGPHQRRTGLTLVWALVGFGITLPVSVLAVRWMLGWLRHRQIMDHPNERSSHSQPTPRGGGLAVTPVVLLAWSILAGAGLAGAGPEVPGLPAAIAGAALLLGLSWLDDRSGGLSARLRLAGHLGACLLGLAMLPPGAEVFQGWLPLWADRLATLLAWVWFVNLTNFMDGIDGITGVQTAVVGLGLALLSLLFGGAAGIPALALTLTAAALGFLVWNWHPAKLFLGDSGSIPLGYLTGWLLIEAATHGHLAAAVILPLYYLADATITLGRRLLRGQAVWQAHREHFYQQAVRGRATHDRVAGMILAADVALVALALLSADTPWPALALAGAVVALLLRRLHRLGPETAS